jgi:sigma-E factor negative regulatory protein RseC
MMETRGRIAAIANGIAEVRIAAISACGSCRSQQSCGTAAAAANTQIVRVDATPGMHTGDEISLQMEAATVAGGALLGYLMPAVSVIGGAIAGSVWFGSDVAAAVGAGLGLSLGLLALRFSNRHIFRNGLHPAVCASSSTGMTNSLTGD